MPSDEELMQAVRRGDLAAFEQIVVRHETSAWETAYRFLGDSAEAEDLAQEAFLKILDAAPRYRPTAAFRTYLFRVVSRLCLDRARKKRPLYVEALPDAPDGRPSPLDAVGTREDRQAVAEALDGLPANQRIAVVLRYYEGLGYREIALAMRTSTKAVERLLARARASLQARLGDLREK